MLSKASANKLHYFWNLVMNQGLQQKVSPKILLVDSYEIFLSGTLKVLRSYYPVADKCLSTQETLNRVKWSLQGLTHTKDIKAIKSGLELKPEWLRLLNLAFEEGLQDKAIAAHICVSERMVRHYWFKLQEVLDMNVNELKNQGKNLRVVTHIRAREEGFID